MLIDNVTSEIEEKIMDLSDLIYQNTGGQLQELKVDKIFFDRIRNSYIDTMMRRGKRFTIKEWHDLCEAKQFSIFCASGEILIINGGGGHEVERIRETVE